MKRFFSFLICLLLVSLPHSGVAADWQWTEPTPGKENLIQRETASTNVTAPLHMALLSEVIVQKKPESLLLQIEVKNVSTDTLSLEGWGVRVGDQHLVSFNQEKIKKGGYALTEPISFDHEKNVFLLNPEGDVEDLIVLPDSWNEDVSQARFCEDEQLGWCTLQEGVPTPGKENLHIPLHLWAEVDRGDNEHPKVRLFSSDTSAKMFVVMHPESMEESPVLYDAPFGLPDQSFLFFGVRNGLPSAMYTFDVHSENTRFERHIFISELLPNPVGKDAGGEWVELWNSGNVDLVLSTLFLTTKEDVYCDEGEVSTQCFSLQYEDPIAPGEHRVIHLDKLSLPNTTGTLFVVNSEGVVYAETDYNAKGKARGASFNLVEKEPYTQYAWADIPTPASAYVQPTLTSSGTTLQQETKKVINQTTKKTKKGTSKPKKKPSTSQEAQSTSVLDRLWRLLPSPKKVAQSDIDKGVNPVSSPEKEHSLVPVTLAASSTDDGKKSDALSLALSLMGGMFSLVTGTIFFKP